MPHPTLNLQLNTAAPLRERLEWLTDIQIARNGTESRFALRAVPRRVFSVESILEDAQRWLFANHTVFNLPAHPWGFPAGDYELLTDSVELEHLTPQGADAFVQLQLLLVENTEVVEPYTLMQNQAYLWPTALTPDGRANFKDGVTWSANTFDAGHLRARQLRHKKRTLSVLVTLLSASEIVLFRRFLHALRGRAFPFRFAHPVNGYTGTYRLAHDAVELTYLTSSVAECELRIVELTSW